MKMACNISNLTLQIMNTLAHLNAKISKGNSFSGSHKAFLTALLSLKAETRRAG